MTTIDWSPVDRAVNKVIAKHDALFTIDRIMAEKIDESLHPLIKMPMIFGKAIRASKVMARYKQICMSIGLATNVADKTILTEYQKEKLSKDLSETNGIPDYLLCSKA